MRCDMRTAGLIVALALLAYSFSAEAQDRTGLWKGRFRIENPGPGYKVNIDSASLAAGTNLFDLISVLPGVTYESGQFKINGSAVSGIYINDVKIYELFGLKYISTDGISTIRVTYAPDGDSSAGSDGGKIKVYYKRKPEGLTGILSAGSSHIPTKGFGNAMIFSSMDVRKGKFSFSNILHYDESREYSNSIRTIPDAEKELKTFSSISGPGRDVNEKMLFRYDIDGKNSLSGSFTFGYNYSNPMNITESEDDVSTTFNESLHTKYGGEIIYNLSMPGKLDLSAAVSYSSIQDLRNNRYISGTESGENAKVGTDDIEASVTAAVALPEGHNLVAGMEVDAILSDYSLLSAYGDTSFDDRIKSAGTEGYVTRVYTLLTGKLGIVSYSAGLNLQANIVSYSDNTTGKYARNEKSGINPTLKINLPLDREERYSMDFIYRHTTGDIPYKAITPYKYWSDEYNYTIGNPSVRPPSSDMVMAVFNLFSSALNIGLTYRCDRDEISYMRFNDEKEPGVSYIMPVNLGRTHTASLNIGVSFTESKYFKSRLFLRGDLMKENSEVDGVHYGSLRTKAYMSLNNSFYFGKGFGAELNARYQPGYRYYEKTYLSDYAVFGSAFKTFIGGKLRLAVNFTAFAGGGSFTTDDYRYINTSDGRYIGLSASWRF